MRPLNGWLRRSALLWWFARGCFPVAKSKARGNRGPETIAPIRRRFAVTSRDCEEGGDRPMASHAPVALLNSWGAVSSTAPYGGYKQSGYGREMGFSVMRELTQEKSVWVNVR